jgi:CRP-like cAMP-binding protein
MASLSAPAFLGEMELEEGRRRTARVQVAAESPAEALMFSRDAFQDLVEASDMVADEVAALVQTGGSIGSLVGALVDLPSARRGDILRGTIVKVRTG